MKETCQICGEGFLTELHSLTLCEYRGFTKNLDTIFSTCDGCGSDQVDSIQTKYNKQNFIEWKQEVDLLIKKWTDCVDKLANKKEDISVKNLLDTMFNKTFEQATLEANQLTKEEC